MSGLTIKQDRFARHYVTDGNGTQAAIKAGYSPIGAHVQSSENLRKPKVAAAIAALRKRQAERLDISREKIVNDIAHLAEQSAANDEYAAAIKANELILKAQGYLVERQLNMSVDITQSHLDSLKQYTDKRIEEAVGDALASLHTQSNHTQHNSNHRVTDVMEHSTHADATDNADVANPLTDNEERPPVDSGSQPPGDG